MLIRLPSGVRQPLYEALPGRAASSHARGLEDMVVKRTKRTIIQEEVTEVARMGKAPAHVVQRRRSMQPVRLPLEKKLPVPITPEAAKLTRSEEKEAAPNEEPCDEPALAPESPRIIPQHFTMPAAPPVTRRTPELSAGALAWTLAGEPPVSRSQPYASAAQVQGDAITYSSRPAARYAQATTGEYAINLPPAMAYEKPRPLMPGYLSSAPVAQPESLYRTEGAAFTERAAYRKPVQENENYADARRVKATIAFDVSVQTIDEDETVQAQYRDSLSSPPLPYGQSPGTSTYGAASPASYREPAAGVTGPYIDAAAPLGAPVASYGPLERTVQYMSQAPPEAPYSSASSVPVPSYIAAQTAGHLASAVQMMCNYVLGSYAR